MRTHFPEAMIVAIADREACRALLRDGSRSFFAASHLLPLRVREPATALYAFCRIADDAVDMEGDVRRQTSALERLRDRLDRAYRGVPLAVSADRAFAAAIRRHDIPRALPEALLQGLAWDAEGRRYETLADLHAYAARVAGAVGVMMALVMGVRDHAALARASDLGAAMQLTNIARDIGEDARNGRIYLPLEWLREAGIDTEAFLANPSFSPVLGGLVARLLAEADRLYTGGESGIAALPKDCRRGIMAARLIYAEIGREIARAGHDSVVTRAVVTRSRKLALVARAARPRWVRLAGVSPQYVLPQAQFLLDAVMPRALTPRVGFGEQVLWVLDLFERVERRRQVESGL